MNFTFRTFPSLVGSHDCEAVSSLFLEPSDFATRTRPLVDIGPFSENAIQFFMDGNSRIFVRIKI